MSAIFAAALIAPIALPVAATAQFPLTDDAKARDWRVWELSSESRYPEALELAKEILSEREKTLPSNHPELAVSLDAVGKMYLYQGRFPEAEDYIKRSLAILEIAFGRDDVKVSNSIEALSRIYGAQGRYAEAEPLIKRRMAGRIERLGSEHPGVAISLDDLAINYQRQKRYAEVEPLLLRALAVREKAYADPEHILIGSSLDNLAGFYSSQGRNSEAEPLFLRAIAIQEKAWGREDQSVINTVSKLADLYRAQGRYSEAEPLYQRALAVRELQGVDHRSVAFTLDSLSALYRSQGKTSLALNANTRAAVILEKQIFANAGARSRVGTSERRLYRGSFLRNVSLLHSTAARDPDFRDAVARSFHSAQLAHASSAGEAIAGMAARFASGGDALAELVRKRQDLVERWRKLDADVVKAIARPTTERNQDPGAEQRTKLNQTSSELESIAAQIAKDFPAYRELTSPKPLTLEAAQALLSPDEAILFYLVDTNQTWLWVVRREGAELHRVGIGANALKAEVLALRSSLDPAFNPGLKPFPATRAYKLHQQILTPASRMLKGVRHIFVVPDGALESLPMGVLVTEPPKEDPDDPESHREVAWFARDNAVTVLPTVGSLSALRLFGASARAASPFVGIGNPTLEGKPGGSRGIEIASLFRGGVANVDAVRQLAPLAETADELRTVAKLVGASEADLFLGPRATEPQLRTANLDRYRVISFATHGLVAGELSGLAEPALVLTPPKEATPEDDGLLTASKIATLKLNADWVVLSACNTAAGDGAPGASGLSGLAKAFFYAGARSLMVSHWSVPSKATVKLVTGAFAELDKEPGIGRAEALRRSQMTMLAADAEPMFAHPLYWAAFVLAGEGAPGR